MILKLVVNVRTLTYTLLIAFFFLGVVACDSKTDKSTQSKINSKLPIVNIGRLICGGHLPLAIVEKKYQDQLKTFQ